MAVCTRTTHRRMRQGSASHWHITPRPPPPHACHVLAWLAVLPPPDITLRHTRLRRAPSYLPVPRNITHRRTHTLDDGTRPSCGSTTTSALPVETPCSGETALPSRGSTTRLSPMMLSGETSTVLARHRASIARRAISSGKQKKGRGPREELRRLRFVLFHSGWVNWEDTAARPHSRVVRVVPNPLS